MAYVINETKLALALQQGSTQAYFNALAEELGNHFSIKLLTYSELDMTELRSKRLYSSDENSYSTGGFKPIEANAWTELVIEQKQAFIANQHSELANVFFDHELIGQLGLGSVINWPVIVHSQVIGTINLLAAEGAYLDADLQVLEKLAPWLAIPFLLNSKCKD